MDFPNMIAIFLLTLGIHLKEATSKEEPIKSEKENYLSEFSKMTGGSKLRPGLVGIANIPGVPGVDYPAFASVPRTKFLCGFLQPGFYADTEAKCQVWHYCDVDGRQDSFLCPNGTLFNQVFLTCDWWYKVDCAEAKRAYLINGDLYRPKPKIIRMPTSSKEEPAVTVAGIKTGRLQRSK